MHTMHTTRRERLRALRVQVHAILGEDWDVRPVPRQRRSLELICHAAAAEPHAGPELWAQAALWDMRQTFPTPAPVWFHNVRLVHAHGNSAFAEACVKYAPGHGTQL